MTAPQDPGKAHLVTAHASKDGRATVAEIYSCVHDFLAHEVAVAHVIMDTGPIHVPVGPAGRSAHFVTLIAHCGTCLLPADPKASGDGPGAIPPVCGASSGDPALYPVRACVILDQRRIAPSKIGRASCRERVDSVAAEAAVL